ncbi:TBC1 domain family member 9 [Bienertia sinuspersici]
MESGTSLLLKYDDTDWWTLFWSITLGIWLQRNLWVFEKKGKDVREVVGKAIGIIGEYEKANDKGHDEVLKVHQETKRTPPNESFYKVNSDAAVFDDQRFGLGAVMRDQIGEVMAATCLQMEGTFSPDIAEARAVRHAIKIAWEAGFRKLILESDCIKLVSQLKKGAGDVTPFGTIVNDILNIAKDCNEVGFSFVRRSGNFVAHHLSKASKTMVRCMSG